jgi:F0F1-type ATP synthase membrane subunit b/b'
LREITEIHKSNELKKGKYDTETAEARQKAQAGIIAAQKEASDLIYQAKQAAEAQIQQVKAETALEITRIKAEAKKIAEELRKQ